MICTLVLALAARVTVALPEVAARAEGVARGATATTATRIPRNRFMRGLSSLERISGDCPPSEAPGAGDQDRVLGFLAALGLLSRNVNASGQGSGPNNGRAVTGHATGANWGLYRNSPPTS